jgi:hypothetical protein
MKTDVMLVGGPAVSTRLARQRLGPLSDVPATRHPTYELRLR